MLKWDFGGIKALCCSSAPGKFTQSAPLVCHLHAQLKVSWEQSETSSGWKWEYLLHGIRKIISPSVQSLLCTYIKMTCAVPKMEQKLKAVWCRCWTLFPSRFCTGGKLASALFSLRFEDCWASSALSDLFLLHQEKAFLVTPGIFWVTISKYSPYICPAVRA